MNAHGVTILLMVPASSPWTAHLSQYMDYDHPAHAHDQGDGQRKLRSAGFS